MMKRIYPILILLFFAGKTLTAQTLDVHFNGLGFLDNHEYKEFVNRSRTYSGTRLDLDFGLNVDSVNRFVVGANALHEFGAHPFFGKVDPVAYYQYHSQHWPIE